MTRNNFIAQLEDAILRLEQKKAAIEALVSSLRKTHAEWGKLSPSVLALLDEPNELLQAASNEVAPPLPPHAGDRALAPTQPISQGSGEDLDDSASWDAANRSHRESPPPSLLLPAKTGDMAGRTIIECAVKILAESGGGPRHFKQIAREASARGYKSHRPGTEDTIFRSFWAMLNRHPRYFELTGGGTYRLTSDGFDLFHGRVTAAKEVEE